MSETTSRPELDISYRNLLKVAIPISLGGFVQFLVTITDNAFLSQVGMNVMNGAGLGSMLFVTLIMLGIGLASGAQIIIARRYNQHLPREVGTVFSNTFYLSIAMSIGILVLMLLTMGPLFEFLVNSEVVRQYMTEYMEIRFFSLIVYIPALVIAGMYMGLGRTRVLIYSTAVTALVNLGLDWVLIFGHFGFEPMGIQGAAIATLTAEVINITFLWGYSMATGIFKEFGIGAALRTFSWSQSRHILKISLPIMGQQAVALATWTVFFMMVEKLGEQELMSGQIIRFMYLLVFVSILGISQSTKTFVSSTIAQERQDLFPVLLRRLIVINVGGMLLLSHGMILYPDFISGIFTQDEHIQMLTRRSMLTVYPALLLACFSSIFLNTVEGSGKTRYAAFIEVTSSVTYLVLTYYVAVVNPQPIYRVWMNDYLYFGMIVVLSILVLRYTNWKYQKV
ncbi:MAG: MATE family efflux transporter [Flavobacteriales bacterium]|nr:MATE family efflux transporter [Flavobacteriales bacterium]